MNIKKITLSPENSVSPFFDGIMRLMTRSFNETPEQCLNRLLERAVLPPEPVARKLCRGLYDFSINEADALSYLFVRYGRDADIDDEEGITENWGAPWVLVEYIINKELIPETITLTRDDIQGLDIRRHLQQTILHLKREQNIFGKITLSENKKKMRDALLLRLESIEDKPIEEFLDADMIDDIISLLFLLSGDYDESPCVFYLLSDFMTLISPHLEERDTVRFDLIRIIYCLTDMCGFHDD